MGSCFQSLIPEGIIENQTNTNIFYIVTRQKLSLAEKKKELVKNAFEQINSFREIVPGYKNISDGKQKSDVKKKKWSALCLVRVFPMHFESLGLKKIQKNDIINVWSGSNSTQQVQHLWIKDKEIKRASDIRFIVRNDGICQLSNQQFFYAKVITVFYFHNLKRLNKDKDKFEDKKKESHIQIDVNNYLALQLKHQKQMRQVKRQYEVDKKIASNGTH